jgi:hypothetical protein
LRTAYQQIIAAQELDEEFDVLLGSGLPKLLTALKTEVVGLETGEKLMV